MVIFLDANKKMNILNISIFVYIILYQLIILPKFLAISDFICASFIVLLTTLAFIFFGFRRMIHDTASRDILGKTISLVLIYFIVSYGLGLATGFNRNAYSTEFPLLIRNTICPLIIIIAMEIYRYIVVSGVKSKKMIVFSVVALIMFEAFVNVKVASLDSFITIFRFLTITFIPIVVKNIILTLICRYGGITTTLFYRIPIEMYIYLLPIIPDFNNYLTSMIGVCFPLILYMILYGAIVEKDHPELNVIDSRMLKPRNHLIDVVGVAFVVVLISLVSGFFPYTLIAVGSDSMAPYVRRGDAIIYKRIKDANQIHVSDVVVYHNKNVNRDVIHRIVKIDKEDGVVIFTTRGDLNKADDHEKIKLKDIKGKVKTKIRYLGYPTLVFKKIIKSEG